MVPSDCLCPRPAASATPCLISIAGSLVTPPSDRPGARVNLQGAGSPGVAGGGPPGGAVQQVQGERRRGHGQEQPFGTVTAGAARRKRRGREATLRSILYGTHLYVEVGVDN